MQHTAPDNYMDTFTKAFEQAIAEMPPKILADAIKKKLDAHGVKLSKRKLDRMAANALKGEPIDDLSVIDRIKEKLGIVAKEIVIEFTDEDTAAIQSIADGLLDEVPKIIEGILETAPPRLLETLKSNWKREAKLQDRDKAEFRKRLKERWGDGLELLKMFITIAREVGSNINTELRKDTNTHQLGDVLTRLHARACQIAEEIVCLLENGFSDGAMARWRTLHEVSAASSIIREHGEELAERYVAHEVIESVKAARLFRKYHERLGQPAMPPEDIAEIETQKDALIAKYGKEFGGTYGWASKHLKLADPTLAQLIEAAKIDHLSPYYKMASHNVHANPKGIFFKLGSIGESEVLLAGASNAGLADPGHSTAISLMQITTALALISPTLDDIVALKIMEVLVDEIGESLLKAHEQLEQDEENLLRTVAPGSSARF